MRERENKISRIINVLLYKTITSCNIYLFCLKKGVIDDVKSRVYI